MRQANYVMINLLWHEVISQCSLKIVENMADDCLKPLRVGSGEAKCGSKCQAKSIHASQDSFGAIIRAVVGTDPGEAWPLVFLPCFFHKQLHLWI